MSELYGRQILFIFTFGVFTIFDAGVCGSQNMQTVIILRFFAGSFGSSPLTNAGGVIADMFPARQRGVATAIFAAAPFLGPAIGPVIGGFLADAAGWRWLAGLLATFSGLVWFVGMALAPETYAPVLLRKRAARLSKITGKVYKSKGDAESGSVTAGEALRTALSRPWILLFREPIVFILSLYMAIVYGTLYMLFSAYPIVYEESRGWSAGISGLAFIGVLIGMLAAVTYTIYPENPRYQKVVERNGGMAPPEARLPSTIIGGICLPVGLFWFAWTNYPSFPWAASMAAGIPFGFGMVLVFLGITNYLIDAYTIFAASVLAANAVIRSCFGAAFPLFTTYMYKSLGIHWASTIPAFLALACVPFPFLFYYYGEKVRMKSKYAREADVFMKKIMAQKKAEAEGVDEGSETETDAEKVERDNGKEELKEEEEEE
jgi:MFS family permease